jgi:hypothetical protein
MKHFSGKYKFHILLIIIGLLWIFLFDALTQMASQGIIYPDSFSYCESAKNLYVFHRGHNYRPILMAVINGLPYLFGGNDASVYAFSFYVNLFCWLASSLVLFEIGKSFLKPKTAFVVSVLFLSTLGNMAYVFHMLTENIYLFFILTAFYFLLKYYKTKAFKWLSISLSIFILAMLVKPGSMYLGIVLSLFFIKEIIRNYKSKFALFFYGSIFLVLVQCAGIKHQFGNFTISYIDAVTYYGYLSCRAESLRLGTEYIQENNPRGVAMYHLPMPEQKKRASEDLKKQVTTNTINLLKAYVIDLTDNTKSGTTAIMDCKNVKGNSYFGAGILFWISKWQNRIFSIIGLVLAVFYFFKSYKKEMFFSLMAFFILYIILLSGISCSQGDRFHIITFPFIFLLGAKWLSRKKPEKI